MCMKKNWKLKKGIIGYDTNALYLYCLGDVMPCSKDTLVVSKKLFDQKRIAKFSKVVLKGKVFRFAQVDIEIPDELCDKFGEMSPLFVVQEIPDRDIPEEMKIFKRKTGRKGDKEVLGCYEGKKDPFVHAPDWMVPTTWSKADSSSSIDWIQPGIPFSLFPEEVVNARREADKDPLKKLSDLAKLKGNKFYGKMIEDLGRHKSTKLHVKKGLLTRSLGLRFLTI